MKNIKRILSVSLTIALLCLVSVAAIAAEGNQLVTIDLWNAHSDQPSMGNIATDNNEFALYNPTNKTLQIATNPVDVSGYRSGIMAAQYDSSGDGDFVDVDVLSTGTVETGTKNDGTNHTVEFLSSFEIDVPDYLSKTGVEYINFKMSVPHTPMDIVVGTGFLDARLRINWDEMTASELEVIVPNIEISSGEVEQLILREGGLSIIADTTVLPENVELSVTEITSGADYEKAKTALEVEDFDLFAVSLTASGAAVTPTGSLEIIFPYSNLPELYRINDDGSKTVLRGTSSVDGYSILSRNVSLFAVVDGERIAAVEQPETPAPAPAPASISSNFADIKGHWGEQDILKAVAAGLFSGTGENTFSPDLAMNQAMIITVLHRMAGEPQVAVPAGLALTACVDQNPEPEAAPATSESDIEIAAEAAEEPRIIATSYATMQILESLELDIIARSETAGDLSPKYAAAPTVGTAMAPDAEAIVMLDPSDVIGPDTLIETIKPTYDAAGIEGTWLDLQSVEGLYQGVAMLGEKYGKQDLAEEIISEYEAYMAEFAAEIEGKTAPRVMVLMGMPGSYIECTNNSYVGSLVELAGAENVVQVDTIENFVNWNTEELLLLDPDIILLTAHGLPDLAMEMFTEEFATNDVWKNFRAVEEGQVYALDYDTFGMSATYAWTDGFEDLQEIFYEGTYEEFLE